MKHKLPNKYYAQGLPKTPMKRRLPHTHFIPLNDHEERNILADIFECSEKIKSEGKLGPQNFIRLNSHETTGLVDDLKYLTGERIPSVYPMHVCLNGVVHLVNDAEQYINLVIDN